MTEVRVLTWNLQGSRGLDVAAAAAAIGATNVDVVVLQEVSRRQARALASALGAHERWWVFKHWSIRAPPEGAAVLTPHRLVATSSFVLRWALFWSWRRRVAIEATMSRRGDRFAVIGVHLSPHGAVDERRREARLVVERATTHEPRPIICGDLNDQPGGAGYETLAAAGWRDAWRVVHGDSSEHVGSTNWTTGNRRGRPPTQRIDYVLAPPGWQVEHCAVAVDRSRLDDAAVLSDHLPVLAVLRAPSSERERRD
jgi:endonuclease/exonuclease/phosphatase family metal-dependent hydrolase